MKNQLIRVIIAEDHAFLRDGLVSYLNNQDEIEVVAQASSSGDLLAKVNLYKADVIVTDLIMPGISGSEIICELKKRGHGRIVILSLLDNEAVIFKMLQLGAKSFVNKGSNRDEVVKAILNVYKHEPYFCPLSMRKVKEIMKALRMNGNHKSGEFTTFELQIIEFICKENTSAEIAKKLNKSKKQIDRTRTTIIEKMGVKGSIGIALYAVRNSLLSGWISPSMEVDRGLSARGRWPEI